MARSNGVSRAPRQIWALVLSLASHAAVLGLILWPAPRMTPEPEARAVTVSLVPAPQPQPSPAPPSEAPPAPAAAPKAASPPAPRKAERPSPQTPRPQPRAKPVPVGRDRPAPPAAESAAEEGPPVLSATEIANATRAGSGAGAGEGPGGGCNMVRYLQDQLRRDDHVRAALAAAGAGEHPALVWRDGYWIRSPGEEGEGLAIVRQAMMVKIAFAPEACRRDPVSGLVLITLADAPGAPQIALGAPRWAWSDLLGRG